MFSYNDWLTTRLMWAKADVMFDIDFDVAGALEDAGAPAVIADAAQLEADKYLRADYPVWDYVNAAVKVDLDRWYFMTEGYITSANMEVPFEQRRWYVSTGLRFGKIVYLATLGRSEDTAEEVSDYISYPASVLVDQFVTLQTENNRSITLGVRIDTTRTTALKFDLIQFEEFASHDGETAGIGKNMLMRAAFSASF